jgi:hypothetical protein
MKAELKPQEPGRGGRRSGSGEQWDSLSPMNGRMAFRILLSCLVALCAVGGVVGCGGSATHDRPTAAERAKAKTSEEAAEERAKKGEEAAEERTKASEEAAEERAHKSEEASKKSEEAAEEAAKKSEEAKEAAEEHK